MGPWVLVVVLRLLIPLLILRWPLFGLTAALLADTLDVVVLDLLHVSDYSLYNPIDKLLDTYLYLIVGYTALFWKNSLAKKTAIFLLIYRLAGVIVYEITAWRGLLFVFPDLFVFYVAFYLISTKLLKRDFITSAGSNAIVLVILLIPKLLQEYALHVIQFPIYGWIRQHILRF
jgi:hypothetical protein